MKEIYFFILLLIYILSPINKVVAVSLTADELKTVNDMTEFIDKKPTERSLLLCKKELKSSNVVLKGLASIIMYKHYKNDYETICANNISLNRQKTHFEQDKKIIVKLDNLQKLLKNFDGTLKQFNDERVKKLFLFYHFRHKNVSLIGKYKEELNLAEFYRMAFLSEVFINNESSTEKLIQQADKK